MVAGVVVLVVVGYFVVGGVSLVTNVLERNRERDRFGVIAAEALPSGAELVRKGGVSGTQRGTYRGYADGFSAQSPSALLAARTAPGGDRGWTEVYRDAGSVGWLSADKVLVATLKYAPCGIRVGCPTGGTFVSVEVVPGGPGG